MLSFLFARRFSLYRLKGGVAQLAKALAVAWAAEGIRVNTIAPVGSQLS
jgi:NAD(P)-dependent dehydrogenase (short-subunit alcohol dehydrogenase family)